MSRVLYAEWTKLRTEPAALWLVPCFVVVTVLMSLFAVASASCGQGGCGIDPAVLSLAGVQLGQALVVLPAVLTIGGEHSTGLLRTTLTATPRRIVVLAAKAVLTGGLALVAGTAAVLGCVAVGRAVLPGNGIAALSLTDGPMLRATAGSVLYLVLIGLLALGVAAVIRDAAASAGAVLALLYAVPLIAAVINDPELQRTLRRFAPMTAGLAVQATTDLQRQPIGPWAGLAVLAAWSAAALLCGGLAFRLRDP
ncbi:ABC transporter permease [Actinoplanes auranticolor]|uniref:ABC transporter n=1 Tax=Actinoplanes auranticolor TaxID=47988 RepID=A0A919VQM5_9ACTN|nr:ABC transporter permease [Actinoplanes auranticolor]GIM65671.1 ABC transporter [Actinoplanes auranticolor]